MSSCRSARPDEDWGQHRHGDTGRRDHDGRGRPGVERGLPGRARPRRSRGRGACRRSGSTRPGRGVGRRLDRRPRRGRRRRRADGAPTSRFAIVDAHARRRAADRRAGRRLRIRRPLARRLDPVRRRAPAGSAGRPLPGPRPSRRRPGVMRAGVIVDKRERRRGDGRLADRPGAAFRRPRPHPLSRRGAPVHPRPQQHRGVGGLPRPAGDRRGRREGRARLGHRRDGRRAAIFAINATLGLAVEVDPGRPRGPAVGPFEPSALAASSLAKFGHAADGAGRSSGRGRAGRIRVLRGGRPAASSGSIPTTWRSTPRFARGHRRRVDGRDARRRDHLCAPGRRADGS